MYLCCCFIAGARLRYRGGAWARIVCSTASSTIHGLEGAGFQAALEYGVVSALNPGHAPFLQQRNHLRQVLNFAAHATATYCLDRMRGEHEALRFLSIVHLLPLAWTIHPCQNAAPCTKPATASCHSTSEYAEMIASYSDPYF